MVSALIATGLIAPIALLSAQIYKNMLQAQKDVESRYSVDHLFSDMRATLGDVNICTHSLHTLSERKLPSTGTAPLNSIKNADGTGDLYLKNGSYQGGTIKIQKMEISPFVPDPVGIADGYTNLSIYFNKPLDTEDSYLAPKDIILSVKKHTDGSIEKCWARFMTQHMLILSRVGVCPAGETLQGFDNDGNKVCVELLHNKKCETNMVLVGFDEAGEPICKKYCLPVVTPPEDSDRRIYSERNSSLPDIYGSSCVISGAAFGGTVVEGRCSRLGIYYNPSSQIPAFAQGTCKYLCKDDGTWERQQNNCMHLGISISTQSQWVNVNKSGACPDGQFVKKVDFFGGRNTCESVPTGNSRIIFINKRYTSSSRISSGTCSNFIEIVLKVTGYRKDDHGQSKLTARVWNNRRVIGTIIFSGEKGGGGGHAWHYGGTKYGTFYIQNASINNNISISLTNKGYTRTGATYSVICH